METNKENWLAEYFKRIFRVIITADRHIKNLLIVCVLVVIVFLLYSISYDTSVVSTVCVSITVSIMGIAFPIIVNNITNIGRQYSSIYLKKIFDKNHYLRAALTSLIFALISSVFIIFKLRHLFSTHIRFLDYIINNSANLFCAISTIFLVVFFIRLLNVLYLFNSHPMELVSFLIKEAKKSAKIENDENRYLKALNEFAVYSVRESDYYLQQVLLKFFDSELSVMMRSVSKQTAELYSSYLHKVVYDIVKVKVNMTDDSTLLPLEEKSIDCSILLKENVSSVVVIPDATYESLWEIQGLIITKEIFFKKYWQTAYTFASFSLKWDVTDEFLYNPIYSIQLKKHNKDTFMAQRDFMVHHLALGGMLIYRQKYRLLKYIFRYTTGEYVLSPLLMNTVDGIWGMFVYLLQFSNYTKYNRIYQLDESESANLHSVDYIYRYLMLLYIKYLVFCETNPDLYAYYYGSGIKYKPTLPRDLKNLKVWAEIARYMEETAKDVFEDKNLISALFEFSDKEPDSEQKVKEIFDANLSAIINDIENLMSTFRNDGKDEGQTFASKFSIFNESLQSIFKACFEKNFDYLLLTKSQISTSDSSANVSKNLFFLPPFYVDDNLYQSEEEVRKYFISLASDVISDSVDRLIGRLFLQESTARYLITSDMLDRAIQKITAGNASGFKIFVFNPSDESVKLFESLSFKPVSIRIFYDIKDVLFILKDTDLPYLETITYADDVLSQKFKLPIISDKKPFQIDYVSQQGNGITAYTMYDDSMSKASILRNNVKITLIFATSICWKSDHESIVRIDLATGLTEQGIENSIDDIVTLGIETDVTETEM